MKSTKRVRNYKRNLRKTKKKMQKSRKMKGGAASLNPSMWAIELDEGKKNFSVEDSTILTNYYLQQNFKLDMDPRKIGIFTHRIDLLNLTQTNKKYKTIRRLYLPDDDRLKWSVKTDTGIQPYNLEISHKLTKIYVDTKKTAEEKTYIYIRGRFKYEINVVNLTQTNLSTRKMREVILPEFLSGAGGASLLGTIAAPSFKGVNTTVPGGSFALNSNGGLAASRRPVGSSLASSSSRTITGAAASKIPVGNSMISSSKTTTGPGLSTASSMTLIPGDGKYGVKNIDDLKPSFRHMDDREKLIIEYSEMEKLRFKDLETLLTKAKTKRYPWGDIGVRIPYFEKLLSEGLGGSPSQVMTIERHRFDKSEYMGLQELLFKFNPGNFKITTGYFDLSQAVAPNVAISDFANRYLGGNYLGGGLVQEELMFHKTPILFLTQLDQYIKGTPITLPGYDSIVIKGAIQLWDIDMYKKFRPDWDSRTELLPTPIGPSNIVAFDALNLKRTKGDDGLSLKGRKKTSYLAREVIWHIIKYYNTFNGAFESGIRILHTGSVGAGVFGHSHAASFLMQMFACCLVNIKNEGTGEALTLILHTDPKGKPVEKEQVEGFESSMAILSSLHNKISIKDALTEIKRIITTNEGGLYTVRR